MEMTWIKLSSPHNCKFLAKAFQKIVKLTMRSLSTGQKAFYKQVCTVACLILVLPATNAASERSFSTMRRLRRSTMGQARLNHLMVLNIHKEILDLWMIANEFGRGSEH